MPMILPKGSVNEMFLIAERFLISLRNISQFNHITHLLYPFYLSGLVVLR